MRIQTAYGEFVALYERFGREPDKDEWLALTDYTVRSYYKCRKEFRERRNEK